MVVTPHVEAMSLGVIGLNLFFLDALQSPVMQHDYWLTEIDKINPLGNERREIF